MSRLHNSDAYDVLHTTDYLCDRRPSWACRARRATYSYDDQDRLLQAAGPRPVAGRYHGLEYNVGALNRRIGKKTLGSSSSPVF